MTRYHLSFSQQKHDSSQSRTARHNRCSHSGQKNTAKKYLSVDLVCLLERTIKLMAHEPENKSSSDESGSTGCSWLLQQYYRRVSTLEKECNEENTPASVLIEHETRTFSELVTQLPPHLVFSDYQNKTLSASDISAVVAFVNNALRVYTGISCCLPLNITSHLLKGLLLTPSRVKEDSSAVTKSVVKQFCQECPLFFVSLQHYWEHVSVIVSCMSGNSDVLSAFTDIDTLHSWTSSLCSGTSVSTATPLAYPPWIIASCVYLILQNNKNNVNCYQRLLTTMDPILVNKISVCLFACILSNFVEIVLHGKELTENKEIWAIAMDLLQSCPDVLFCFMEDTTNYTKDLDKLRTLILPDKYTKLLPIVFFSILTDCKQYVIEKVKVFSQFKQVTIRMNQEFTQLRKMCLENQALKSCEKTFQLEFARKVFQFLRHHVGS